MASSLAGARQQLNAYVDTIEATVLSAYGMVGHVHGGRADPPPMFGAPAVKPSRRKSVTQSAGGAGGTQHQVVEWRRLQQENAELLFLVAMANEALGPPHAPGSAASLLHTVGIADKPTTCRRNGALSLRLQASHFDPVPQSGLSDNHNETDTPVSEAPSSLDELCKLMVQTCQQASRHAAGMPPTATMSDDHREVALPPHRRAVTSAMQRLTAFVFSPLLVHTVETTSTRSTQTAAKNDPSGLGRLFVPRRVGALNSSLDAALRGSEWVPDAIAAALLPFRVQYTVPTLLSSGPMVRRLNNVERLHRLLQHHRGAPTEHLEGDTARAAPEELRAGPEAVALLERFVLTERRPRDFREGVAPANSKYYHEEDPLLAAHPCVYLPTMSLLMQSDATTPTTRLHHAWVLICQRAAYLLVDTRDTPQQLREDALALAHIDDVAEVHRKLAKLWRKRKEQRESDIEQLRDDTLLLEIIDWRSQLVNVDLSQTGAAFLNRTLKDTHPVLLNALPCPRIDRLMACYPPSYASVDPAEMGQQLYRSMVFHTHHVDHPRHDKMVSSRHAVVFLHATQRNEVASLLWATLHPSRCNGDVFAAVRSVEALLPTTAAHTTPSSHGGAPAATSRIGANDPVAVVLGDGSPRPDAMSSTSPMLRYSEPVVCSSHADWYPMHHVLTEQELALCRAVHVHPHILCLLKHTLFLRPERAWFSLMDVAVILMAATEAAHVCLLTAERIVDFYLSDKQRLCEAIEIITRLPA